MIREQFNIFTWNCHGTTDYAFVRVCKNYIHLGHPDIFIIMETRVDPKKHRKKFSTLIFYGYAYSNVVGYSSGIDMEWKQDNVSITIE